MKRSVLHWLAISALLIAASASQAETRPQYGGSLHIAMRLSRQSLDPGDISDTEGGRQLVGLIFDTLVTMDVGGRPNSGLAQSWQSDPGGRRVEFRLRPNLKFHDGSSVTSEIVSASLSRSNPAWKIAADGDRISIESGNQVSELLQELALPRNAIAKRDGTGSVSGTGAFRVLEWQPAKRLALVANEDYWNGRPFLDQIAIDMGVSYRDQMNALESGRADLVEVAPEQIHHLPQRRYELRRSNSIELIALKFAKDAASDREKTAREALRLSIERQSMHNVLLQGAGQPAASLLPTWMSGYGFVFPTEADRARAQQLRDQIPGVPSFELGYEGNDPLMRLLAERVALNAKDAGLWVQLKPSTTDLRLVRIQLVSPDPWISLQVLSRELGLPPVVSNGQTIDQLFAFEQSALTSGHVIPLFHVPIAFASITNLHDWELTTSGALNLASAWLKSSQP
ncbi:MAG TPA: ABC transporter substrate-binding protein [Candidatus Sulfotelmatobacter sp.]|nr:ABC transporter substrate-binding protein [Candidatus Sulfotelmatobacter sp.]